MLMAISGIACPPVPCPTCRLVSLRVTPWSCLTSSSATCRWMTMCGSSYWRQKLVGGRLGVGWVGGLFQDGQAVHHLIRCLLHLSNTQGVLCV